MKKGKPVTSKSLAAGRKHRLQELEKRFGKKSRIVTRKDIAKHNSIVYK